MTNKTIDIATKLWLSLLCRGQHKWWHLLLQAARCMGAPSRSWLAMKRLAPLPESIKRGFDVIDWAEAHRCLTWYDASSHHHLIFYDDALYPDRLRQIDSPPTCLFAYGDPSVLNQQALLAVVGARKATVSGLMSADMIASDLASKEVGIVSGLALGIDAAAHQACLRQKGVTIAFMGTGCDTIYPKEHRALAQDIVAHGGVLVSEYPVGTPPLARHFPQRNRLVSGLSAGVIVVEAAKRSGAMITVNEALKQGKEVFAIPQSIHSSQSSGTLWLIQQGAKCVTSSKDILEEYAWGNRSQQPLQASLTQRVILAIEQGINTEQAMMAHLQASPQAILEILIELCGRGVISLDLCRQCFFVEKSR